MTAGAGACGGGGGCGGCETLDSGRPPSRSAGSVGFGLGSPLVTVSPPQKRLTCSCAQPHTLPVGFVIWRAAVRVPQLPS